MIAEEGESGALVDKAHMSQRQRVGLYRLPECLGERLGQTRVIEGRLLRLLFCIDEKKLVSAGNGATIHEAAGALDPLNVAGHMQHEALVFVAQVEGTVIICRRELRVQGERSG